jgi:hypothetical protein
MIEEVPIAQENQLEKSLTGIKGLDEITGGGCPRTTDAYLRHCRFGKGFAIDAIHLLRELFAANPVSSWP